MKKISLIALAFVMLFVLMSTVHAQSGTLSFTSMWDDYKTSVPEGWHVSYDFEGTHYADTTFKGEDYSLSIRWYTRYSTHRLPSGLLEMYSGIEDYASKTLHHAGDKTTVARDVTIGNGSVHASEFAIHSTRESAYTLVRMPSGFYVFIYSAPQSSFSKYENFYNTMVASLAFLKDGPGGAPCRGLLLQWKLKTKNYSENYP